MMTNPAKYRIVESYVGKHKEHYDYAIQVHRWWGWDTLDTGRDLAEAPSRAMFLAGNPLVSAWYDKEGRKTRGPNEGTVTVRNYWLGILAAFLSGSCMVLLGIALLVVGLR